MLSNMQISCWSPINYFPSRPWTAPHKALWSETDENDTFACITGFYCRKYPSIVKDLRLIYQSGSFREIGDLTGPQIDSPVRFEPGDVIHKIEIYRDRVGLLALNVGFFLLCLLSFKYSPPGQSFTTNQATGDNQIRALVDTPPLEIDRHAMGSLIHRYSIDLTKRVFRDDIVEPGGPYGQEESLPDGKAVGIWGAEIPNVGLHLGLLFLQKERASS